MVVGEKDLKYIKEEVKNDVQQLSTEVKELRDIILAVNTRIQHWTEVDYNWKRDHLKRIDLMEENMSPAIEVISNLNAAKKVGLWIVGALTSIGALYLMTKEIFK